MNNIKKKAPIIKTKSIDDMMFKFQNNKRTWKFKSWESLAMFLLIIFNFFIINYFFYSYSEGINNGKYGILLCLFEIVSIYWIVYKFYKNFEPFVILILLPFAIINYIMDSKISEKFISNEIYKEHFFHTGKIVEVIYGSHNSTIKLLTTNGNISVPIENPIDTVYKKGRMIVYGFCKKQHHLWVENSEPSIEICLNFLFPKLFEKGKIMDSINSCYIEKYLQEKGVDLVYKAKVIESKKNSNVVKLQFKNYLSDNIIVSYVRKQHSRRKKNFFDLLDLGAYDRINEDPIYDTFLLTENVNKEINNKYYVQSNINGPHNWSKIIDDYEYFFLDEIFHREKVDKYYPQIKNYVEKFKEQNINK